MVPVLVNSCAAFSDTWGPFGALWRKFWPDCPYDLVLVTDFLERPAPDFDAVVELKQDYQWCGNLNNAIEKLGNPEIVMLTQDDFWVTKEVDGEKVQRAHEFMNYDPTKNGLVGCCRIVSNPPATEKLSFDSEWGEHPKGTMYRTSAGPAFWRTDYLKKLLARTRTVMEFYLHSPADEFPEKVLSMWPGQEAMTFTDSAVVRGKWDANIVEWARSLGIEVDTSKRGFYEG